MPNKKIGVYDSSYSTAKRNDELELYNLSQKENIKCAAFIEEVLENNFNGFKLKADSAKQVIDEFGYDRTNLVLANSVQKKSGDKRIDKECCKWASSFYVPRDIVKGFNKTDEYAVNSDSGLINLIAKQAKREYDSLNLIKYEQCDPTHLDYTDKIMILDPKFLYDEYRTPENQIVKCGGGFGCNPSAVGRRIYGQYMIDDVDCSFDRADFIGELKEENYPDWLKEKLSQTQTYDNSSQNMEQSM